jgi:hypothetical protein
MCLQSATPTTPLLTNWRECGMCDKKTLARIKRVSHSNQSSNESALLLFFSLRIFVKKIIFLGFFGNFYNIM